MEEIVIIMLTWCGPPDRGLREHKLDCTAKTIQSLKQHMIYPNYSWHIADDGSGNDFQQRVIAMLEGDRYTLTDTKACGDIAKNVNLAQEAAYSRSNIAVVWHDDRPLPWPLDLRPYVQMLLEYEDAGRIRVRPRPPWFNSSSVSRCGHKWWRIHKDSPGSFFGFGPNINHRRILEAYGPWPEGLRPDITEKEMGWRFQHIGPLINGPDLFCHDDLWTRQEMPWIGKSTWEWRATEHVNERTCYRNHGATLERR